MFFIEIEILDFFVASLLLFYSVRTMLLIEILDLFCCKFLGVNERLELDQKYFLSCFFSTLFPLCPCESECKVLIFLFFLLFDYPFQTTRLIRWPTKPHLPRPNAQTVKNGPKIHICGLCWIRGFEPESVVPDRLSSPNLNCLTVTSLVLYLQIETNC